LDCPVGSDTPYRDKVNANVAKFYGMITNIDDNIGKLLDHLKKNDLEKNTLLIFMTDNGTATGSGVFNAGMRGAKGTQYTGGTRVPSFWRWPGTLKAGVDVPVLTCHYDIFPTLLDILGEKPSEELSKQIEGRSLLPLLKNPKAEWANREFITHVGRWATGKASESQYVKSSIRDERWSLVFEKGQPGELYDLRNDPGEKTNLAASHPEVAQKLLESHNRWWKRVQPHLVNEDAKPPSINSFHKAYWEQYQGPGPNNVGPKK
jgi:arylsulfatase